jgi:hypothetical protein
MIRSRVASLFALSALLLASPPARAQAEEEGFEDGAAGESDASGWGDNQDDAAGFAEAPKAEAVQHAAEPPSAPSPFSLTGFARSQWGLWLERLNDAPLAKGRQSLDLQLRYSSEHWRFVSAGHAEYDVAYRVERERYDAATLDAYESLVALRETYLSATFEPVEMTFGRIIVPWGQGDVVSVLDTNNPRDLREPGMTDLDDLRVPVLATRFGFFFGYHRIDAMLIHESSYGYRPPPLGDFSPVRSLIQREATPEIAAQISTIDARYDDRESGLAFDKQQYSLSWSYRGPIMDASLHVASLVDQFGVFDGLNPPLALPIPSKLDVVLDHPRYLMFGYSGAVPVDDWLIKWEFSLTPSRTYNLDPPDGQAIQFLTAPDAYTKRATFGSAMLGLTYSGLPGTIVFFEAGQTAPLDAPNNRIFGGNEPVFSLRTLHMLFDEDLQANFTFYGVGWSLDYGFLLRAELTYRLNDDLKASLGAITYHPGDEIGLLSGLSTHDRLFGGLRWDFQAF